LIHLFSLLEWHFPFFQKFGIPVEWYHDLPEDVHRHELQQDYWFQYCAVRFKTGLPAIFKNCLGVSDCIRLPFPPATIMTYLFNKIKP